MKITHANKKRRLYRLISYKNDLIFKRSDYLQYIIVCSLILIGLFMLDLLWNIYSNSGPYSKDAKVPNPFYYLYKSLYSNSFTVNTHSMNISKKFVLINNIFKNNKLSDSVFIFIDKVFIPFFSILIPLLIAFYMDLGNKIDSVKHDIDYYRKDNNLK